MARRAGRWAAGLLPPGGGAAGGHEVRPLPQEAGWGGTAVRPLPWEAGQGRGRGVTEAELRSPHVPDSVSSWCEGGSSVGDCPLFDRGVVRGRDQRVLVQPGQAAHMVKPVRIWGERGGGF